MDLGLCETCCTDTPCGPAGAFAEYAVALAETVAKRDGLSSKDVVGLPLAGHGWKRWWVKGIVTAIFRVFRMRRSSNREESEWT